ncbi:hypothetical protein PO909_011031 [Leuciscus waleckii]
MLFFVACLEDTGTYFPSVKRCPGRYLQPCSDAVKRWLRSMKNSGKILLLITSSHSDYCRLVCEHILGTDFEELFDIIITNALKPGFFSLVPQQRPFRALVDDVEDSEGLPSLEKPGWYSQGNWPHLHELLKNMTNKPEPKVVYFGDSMRSDMFPACSFGKWETVMIVEEMEGEGVPRANATPCNSPAPTEGPAEKKGKFEVGLKGCFCLVKLRIFSTLHFIGKRVGMLHVLVYWTSWIIGISFDIFNKILL